MPAKEDAIDGIERRKFPRHPKKMELKFLYKGTVREGIVQNLSLGGMLFRTRNSILISTPVQFIFELSFGDHFKRCVLHGKVLRVNEDPFGFWPEVGCSFNYSSQDSFRLLNDFLEHSQVSVNTDYKPVKPKRVRRRKDPRFPTWWTSPGASISELRNQVKMEKKSLKNVLKNLFMVFSLNKK